jgi:anaerobic ribonucleoside-triphosphate reductase activating protein
MNIAHIEECSFIYGPGRRFVIWVQGCSVRCKGCWNKEMWSFKLKKEISISELIESIERNMETIEGITLLGGEPLDQFEEVLKLFEECKNKDLTTMLFTGYEMAEIEKKEMSPIIELTDILITGRYDENKRTMNHQWIGSTNQEIHFLTEQYKNYSKIDANYVEISINDLGKINTFGFPDENLLNILNLNEPTQPDPNKKQTSPQ